MIWVIVGSVLGILVGIYILLGIFLYFKQRSIIYRTGDSIFECHPAEYDNVNFFSADGTPLHGWFIPSSNASLTLLFCHGNAGNISHRMESIRLFNELDINLFIFDYRGFGKSRGTPSEKGLFKDAEAAWDYLEQDRGISADNIVILGRSLGGAVASHLAQKRVPKALIIESAFISITEMARNIYPYFPVAWLIKEKLETQKYLTTVSVPKLIVHSMDDTTVPFCQGQKLYDCASEPKRFLKLTGTHNDCYFESETLYKKELNAFISSLDKV